MAIDVKDKDRGFDSPNLRRFMVHQSIKCLDTFLEQHVVVQYPNRTDLNGFGVTLFNHDMRDIAPKWVQLFPTSCRCLSRVCCHFRTRIMNRKLSQRCYLYNTVTS